MRRRLDRSLRLAISCAGVDWFQTRSIASLETPAEREFTTETQRSHREPQSFLGETLRDLCASVVEFFCMALNLNESLKNLQSIKPKKVLIAFHRPPTWIGMMFEH